MVSEVVSGRRPFDQLRPRARPTVGPGRRPGPGHVAPEFWGARGAEGLSRDVPRRPPPVVCRGWSLRRAGVGALIPGSAPRKHDPANGVTPTGVMGRGGLVAPITESRPAFSEQLVMPPCGTQRS